MADDRLPLVIICPTCRATLLRVDVVEQSAQGPRIEFYQCEKDTCVGKLAVLFELSGDLRPTEPGFVEREVGRRGAFFPQDFGAGGARRNW